MKKLIAILTVFALIAPVVFGQIEYGGSIDVSGALLQDKMGKNDKGEDVESKINTSARWDFSVWAGAENREKTIGAKGWINWNTDAWGYIWWKPSDMLYFKMGNVEEDGNWTGDDITGWGFNANDFKTRPEFDEWNGYAGSVLPSGAGFLNTTLGRRSLQLSAYPIEGMAINIGWNFGSNTIIKEAKETYIDGLNFQFVYDLGVGEVALAFVNGSGEETGKPRDIFVQWNMPLADNMRLEFGANYGIHKDIDPPILIGLGFGMGNFDDDAMVLNVRAGVAIPMADEDPTRIGLDILFSYDLNIFRLYVPAGIGLFMPNEGDSKFFYTFSPYIAKDLGGPFFYCGARLYNGELDNGNSGRDWARLEEQITWAIPIGMCWSF